MDTTQIIVPLCFICRLVAPAWCCWGYLLASSRSSNFSLASGVGVFSHLPWPILVMTVLLLRNISESTHKGVCRPMNIPIRPESIASVLFRLSHQHAGPAASLSLYALDSTINPQNVLLLLASGGSPCPHRLDASPVRFIVGLVVFQAGAGWSAAALVGAESDGPPDSPSPNASVQEEVLAAHAEP